MTNATTPEVLEELASLDSETLELTRQNCRKDLYFLSKGVLGRPDVNLRTHGLMCRFMTEDVSLKKLLLLPRGHLKTAVATVDDSVRQTLDDPNARILFGNEIDGTATAIMNEAKAHFENNTLLKLLFPEYIHERFNGPRIKWSNDGAVLPNRTINDKTPTFMSVGVGGAITGMHFTCIKGDDLIGFEARDSATVMAKTKRWIDNLEPLLVSPQYIMHFIGTRWVTDDIYSHIMKMYPDIAVLTRGCIENDEPIFPFDADGKPRFTLKFFDDMRDSNPEMYYAQYENNPQSGGLRDFDASRVRDYWIEGGEVCYEEKIVGVRVIKRWNIQELDIVLIADPAGDKTNAVRDSIGKNDHAGIAVVGVSPQDQVFVLDTFSGRTDPTQFVDLVFAKAVRWRPRMIGIEQVALSTTLHYFNKKMKDAKTWFRTEALRPKNRVKHNRIRTTLEPVIGTDRLFIAKSQRVLRDQVQFFPNIKEDALIDCLGYFPEIARVGLKLVKDTERKKKVEDLLRLRNPLTGY